MIYDQIHTTTDYDQFNWASINRAIDQGQVKRLEKDIESGIGIFTPILVNPNKVNGKYEIADGQHRFSARKNKKRPIRYIFAGHQMSLNDITLINSRQKPWRPLDYVKAYAAAGYHDYMRLLDFFEEVNSRVNASPKLRQLSIRSVTYLTQGSTSNPNQSANKSLKSGHWEFKVPIKEARQNLEVFMAFEQFGCSFNETFMQVVLHLMRNEPEFNVKRLIRQANKYPYKFYNCGRSIDWQRMIEDLYNHGKMHSNRLHFRFV